MTDAQGFVFRQRRQLELDTPRKRQRAFRPDQQMRHIGARGQHHVEVVTADPAQHFRITLLNLFRLAPRNLVDAGDQIAITLGRIQLLQIFGKRAETVGAAVRQPGINAQHVVHHIAVLNRARAAGVVAGHAADGRLRAGRHVHRKPQAVILPYELFTELLDVAEGVPHVPKAPTPAKRSRKKKNLTESEQIVQNLPELEKDHIGQSTQELLDQIMSKWKL